jgi:hypothetical protein
MGWLAVTSGNRGHLDIPIGDRPLRFGDTCELGPASCFSLRRHSRHRRYWRPPRNLAKGTLSAGQSRRFSTIRLPPSLMNCRRPSRSRILMQSPHPARTPCRSSSFPTRSGTSVRSSSFIDVRVDACPGGIAARDAQKNELPDFMVRSCGGASWFNRKDFAWRRSRTRLQPTDHRHPLPEG